jgi:hypothetical protein
MPNGIASVFAARSTQRAYYRAAAFGYPGISKIRFISWHMHITRETKWAESGTLTPQLLGQPLDAFVNEFTNENILWKCRNEIPLASAVRAWAT